jgi:HEAT repeat protein
MSTAPMIHRFSSRAARHLSVVMAVGALALLLAGCGDEREVVFSTDAPPAADDRPKILADIAALANSKDLLDAGKAANYHKAVDALIGRGSRIEPMLIEALGGNDDWGVRLGVIDVLKGVGTKRSIEPLMGALEDPQPLVALNADYLLRGMTKHSVIPAAGEAPRDGLTPVPQRPATDLALDADEKLWAMWHHEHHVALHQAWSTWWQANKATVVVD